MGFSQKNPIVDPHILLNLFGEHGNRTQSLLRTTAWWGLLRKPFHLAHHHCLSGGHGIWHSVVKTVSPL